MSEISVFNFDTHAVRTLTRDGEPWFVAADVCAALGIARTDDGVSRLDDDEKGTDSIRTPGGAQQMTIINESGLYALILGSRKPEAKRFKKWVTSEVLPTLRKTGQYIAPKAKRTYTKSVSFGQELRAVLDLALELRYSTFERNQAVIALLERPGYETLLATLPDRFKQPSPQDEIPDMARSHRYLARSYRVTAGRSSAANLRLLRQAQRRDPSRSRASASRMLNATW